MPENLEERLKKLRSDLDSIIVDASKALCGESHGTSEFIEETPCKKYSGDETCPVDLEIEIGRVKTGIPRFDDLVLGGIPFKSNVLLYGPPFVGKEVFANLFVAEGLKKGIPALWILTDKSPEEIREEMSFIVSDYKAFEDKGLVKYIDAYSECMNENAENEKNAFYVEDPTYAKQIVKLANEIGADFLKTAPYYRAVVRSLSTMVAYSDKTAFKFADSFRKNKDRVSMFLIEKGMHKEQEVESFKHLVDGCVDFKTEQLRTYLRVEGLHDVQSRSYVAYTHSKQNFTIGSFSLDHLK